MSPALTIGSKKRVDGREREARSDATSSIQSMRLFSDSDFLTSFEVRTQSQPSPEAPAPKINFRHVSIEIETSHRIQESELAIEGLVRKKNDISVRFKQRGEGGRVFLGGFFGRNGWWIDRLGLVLRAYSRVQLAQRREHSGCVCRFRTARELVLSHGRFDSVPAEQLKREVVGGGKIYGFSLFAKGDKVCGFKLDFFRNDRKQEHVVVSGGDVKEKKVNYQMFERAKLPYLKIEYDSDDKSIRQIEQNFDPKILAHFNKAKTLDLKEKDLQEYLDSQKRDKEFKTERFVYFSENFVVNEVVYSVNATSGLIEHLGFKYETFD